MKWGLELLLGILCLVAFLCIGKQLLKEPFADLPIPEVYDIQLFFKGIPFSKICDLWLQTLPKINQSFQVDDKGMSLPQDVIQQKVNQYIKTQIPTGPLPCPFVLPESTQLSVIHEFVIKLNDKLLEQAHRTLLFTAIQIQMDLQNSKKALAGKKKLNEGFLTQCTLEELSVQQFVPLQCIDPGVMKATEQETIRKDPNHAQNQKIKKEIALKLFALQKNFTTYLSNAKQEWQKILDSSRKTLTSLEVQIEVLKKKEKEEDADKLRELGEQKQSVVDTIQKATLYTTFLPLSYTQILDQTTKNLAESKQLQQDIQSGKITFTS